MQSCAISSVFWSSGFIVAFLSIIGNTFEQYEGLGKGTPRVRLQSAQIPFLELNLVT